MLLKLAWYDYLKKYNYHINFCESGAGCSLRQAVALQQRAAHAHPDEVVGFRRERRTAGKHEPDSPTDHFPDFPEHDEVEDRG